MKLIDKRTSGKKVRFEDLPIGDAYLDPDENICIKTSDTYESDNCMFYVTCNDTWEAETENSYTEVQPIKITYTVEG